MSDKLAVKHKNSLALNEEKLLQKRNESKCDNQRSRPYQLVLFCIITCCIFLCYWFVLCPLLFTFFHVTYQESTSKHWPIIWPFLYWLIAFLIWLLIMLILIAIWKYLKRKYRVDTKLKSYGTDGSVKRVYSSNIKQHNESVNPDGTKIDDISSESSTKKTKSMDEIDTKNSNANHRYETRKHKDIAPLVIHRYTDDTEYKDVAKEEKEDDDDNEKLLRSEGKAKSDRDSMKEYLKLVTVTPSEDEVPTFKSPKSPLSPRDLFFIDLIREAEKAEQNKVNDNSKPVEKSHFFPKDFSLPDTNDSDKDNESKRVEDQGELLDQSESEQTYFIANVNSPKSEKSEVFLEIDSSPEVPKKWSFDLKKEKPMLKLDDPETKKNKNTKEKVVVFEV